MRIPKSTKMGAPRKLIWLFLLAALPYGHTDGASSMNSSKSPTGTTVINGSHFADLQNTSFLPYRASFKGEEAWLWATGPSPAAVDICIVGGNTLINCGSRIVVLSNKDGKLAWKSDIYNRSAFLVQTDGLVTVDENRYLRMLDFSGTAGPGTHLPILADNAFVLLLCRKGDQAFLAYNSYPDISEGPTSSPQRSRFVVTTHDVKQDLVLWNHKGESLATQVAVSRDNAHLLLLSNDRVLSVPLFASGDEVASVRYKGHPLSFSVAFDGSLMILETFEHGSNLVCVGADKKVIWSAEVGREIDGAHPPLCMPDGRVLVLADRSLVSVANAAVQWKHDLDSPPDRTYVTSLADGNALVATFNRLRVLSADGKAIADIQNPFAISCRPIVDEAGRVYVAGKEGVRCLR